MSVVLHTASVDEGLRLWPAVNAEHIFGSAQEFAAYRDAAPWRLRVSDKGMASLLGAWRTHLGVLAMRGVWCAERHVPAICDDVFAVAAAHGFTQVLSPLMPVGRLGGFRRAGMQVFQRVVAIQGAPGLILPSAPPLDVVFRPAEPSDARALAELDARCFEPFWRYGAEELAVLLGSERGVVADAGAGELLGYTLATMRKGAATLGRLAVAPSGRRCGIGRALVADAATWAAARGALTLGLCTQEDNAASRALYAASGLREVEERYALAISDVEERP